MLRNDLDSHPWALGKDGTGATYINPLPGSGHHNIDFRSPLLVKIPHDAGWHRFPKIPLGPLVKIAQKTSCPFCKLLTQGVYDALQIGGVEDLSTLTVRGYGTRPTGGSVLGMNSFCLLSNSVKGAPTGENVTYSLRVWICSLSGFRGLKAVDMQELSSVTKPGHGRIVRPFFDIEVAKPWLGLDEIMPSERHTPDPASLPNNYFRLVDVNNFCVVNASMTWKYLALSYVWGDSTSRNRRSLVLIPLCWTTILRLISTMSTMTPSLKPSSHGYSAATRT